MEWIHLNHQKYHEYAEGYFLNKIDSVFLNVDSDKRAKIFILLRDYEIKNADEYYFDTGFDYLFKLYDKR